jgi:hypothetical protein
MPFFRFKTPFYATETSTWPVTQQIGAVSRINRRASRGQALAPRCRGLLWRHGAGGGAGGDFKALSARPGAGGGAGACAMLAALCGAFGGLCGVSGGLGAGKRKARRVRAG